MTGQTTDDGRKYDRSGRAVCEECGGIGYWSCICKPEEHALATAQRAAARAYETAIGSGVGLKAAMAEYDRASSALIEYRRANGPFTS
jgi:hypothetical protein